MCHMADASRALLDNNELGMAAPRLPIEEPPGPASSPIVLAICGDPVVGRALVLLLRRSVFDARFLSASSLSDPASLEGVRLLLLTPTRDLGAERREALLASLRRASDITRAPILKLTSSSGAERNGDLRFEHTVSWPCSTEELERRIEATLFADSEDMRTSAGA